MKEYIFHEIENNENFDLEIFYNKPPFTQSNFYGNWQHKLGRKVKRIVVYKNKKIVAYFQLIKYPLLFNKSYCYIPYGPIIKDFSTDFFINLKNELIKIAKTDNIVFIRLDFTPYISDDILSKFFTKSSFYTYHSPSFQPRVEWFLNLNKSEENLFIEMHKKTRYAIKLAEKRKITVEITKDFMKYFEIFYKLMVETAKRNEFSLHNKNYYEEIFKNLGDTESYLSIARFEEKILAINLIIVYNGIANYVFASSSNEERNRMPTYLAQWKSICYAKEIGCIKYNFGGISDKDKIYKSWDNLTRFKKRFGGEEIIHSNFFDLIINPFFYYIYSFRKFIKKFL